MCGSAPHGGQIGLISTENGRLRPRPWLHNRSRRPGEGGLARSLVSGAEFFAAFTVFLSVRKDNRTPAHIHQTTYASLYDVSRVIPQPIVVGKPLRGPQLVGPMDQQNPNLVRCYPTLRVMIFGGPCSMTAAALFSFERCQGWQVG